MAWECIAEGKGLSDERADRKNARGVEKYLVSQNAVYFEGKYLPFSLITALRVQPSVYQPRGCCGRGVPVFKMRLDYGAEKPLVLMLEKEKNAEKLAAAICAANPAVRVEEYVEPQLEVKA